MDRHKGTKAAGLYFILLGLPGSGAFKIFHPVLYNKSLDTFKLVMSLNLARSSPARKKGRGGGGRGASQARGEAAREFNLLFMFPFNHLIFDIMTLVLVWWCLLHRLTSSPLSWLPLLSESRNLKENDCHLVAAGRPAVRFL